MELQTGKKTRRKSSKTRETTLAHPASPAASVDQQEVARRAYAHFLQRGGAEGHDVDDWLTAERELMEERANRRSA
jgi:Protein of unknown function (DUF2934)